MGDYICATQHLSLEEDLMYRRLLDLYYMGEKALTKDERQLFRLTKAASEITQEAVRTVLAEFFQLTDIGWVNKRAEIELKVMRDLRDEKQARRLNEKDRMRRHREKRSQMFDALRAIDVVPAWDISLEELEILYLQSCEKGEESLQRVQLKPATHLQRVQNETATAIPIPIPIPTPIPTPRTNIKKPNTATAVAPPEGVSELVWIDFCQLRKSKRAHLSSTALGVIQKEAVKAGWTLEQALQESCARGWTGFKANWVSDKPTGQWASKPSFTTTVPGNDKPDPALEKIKADRLLAVPIPLHLKSQIRELLQRSKP
jgi:uncharacterized protein YdaU (DUF1376 family)